MLVKKSNVVANDIVTMRLINGEEIIAKLISDDEHAYMVGSPQSLVQTDKGVGLSKSMLTGDDDQGVEILKSSVMMIGPTAELMSNQYTKLTTGIEVVSRQKKIVV